MQTAKYRFDPGEVAAMHQKLDSPRRSQHVRLVDERCQRRSFQDDDGYARLCEPEEGRTQQLPLGNAANRVSVVEVFEAFRHGPWHAAQLGARPQLEVER